MKVVLKVANENQLAECDFASADEIANLAHWPRRVRGRRDQDTTDALEFAQLARKRWRTYLEMERTARSLPELKERIAADKDAEVAMLAIIRIPGKKASVAGFCLFRRTWRNHLMLDLLASDPSGYARISRVGASLLYFVASVGESIGADFIWGEATQGSAPFYRHWFGVPLNDWFRVRASVYRRFQSRYLDDWRKSGLPCD